MLDKKYGYFTENSVRNDIRFKEASFNFFNVSLDELPDDSYYPSDNRWGDEFEEWEWPPEEEERYYREQRRKEFEKKRNIKRDEKGRLNKVAKLAHKDACDELKIWLHYCAGSSVKEIVEATGLGKSTIYNVIKRKKEETAYDADRVHDDRIELSVEMWDKIMDLFW